MGQKCPEVGYVGLLYLKPRIWLWVDSNRGQEHRDGTSTCSKEFVSRIGLGFKWWSCRDGRLFVIVIFCRLVLRRLPMNS